MQDSVRNQQDPSSAAAGGGDAGEVYVFPTTVAQRRFWLLDELAPGNPALNVPLAARLKGVVDVDVLEQVVNEILRRHEVLRSSFRMVDDELVQVAPPERRIELRRYDISHIAESQRESKIHELMLEEGHRKFVLAEGPFLQAAIAKVSDEEHVLMLTMHHIACDGWSNGILMREVALIYSALMRNEPGPEDLPLQYADFSLWQQDWLAGEGALDQERFWLNRLQGKLGYLNLPTDRPRKSGRSHPGTIETRLLSNELGDAIKAYCSREDLTPFMVFFSAFAILLSRYSGRRDVVVGSPAANRGQTELEGLIGLFANPLLLRLNLDGNPTLSGLVARVKDLALGAFANQAYPFERLMEKLELESSRAGVQWLQAYFVFQKAFMVPQEFHGGMLTPLRSISPGSMFEWMLGVLERSEGFRLQLEYNTDLFDSQSIVTMLEQFELLLGLMVREPQTRLDSIDILTPRERELLVLKPNQQRLRVPSGLRAHELFEEHSRVQPSQIAFLGASSEFTYSALNSWANRLAFELRRQGVGPEVEVAIDLPHDSVECVVATLGVLKAGGACALAVSADLDLAKTFKSEPKQRRPLCAITTDSRLTDWIDACGHVLGMPSVQPADTTSPTANLSNIVLGDQPAWIRYKQEADGSLLKICFQHKALLNRVVVDQHLLGLSPSDRLPSAPERFVSVLAAGAVLVGGIPSPRKGLAAWLDWADRREVSIGFLSEEAFEEFVRQGAENRPYLPRRLRTLAVGPTPISPAALSTWGCWDSGAVKLLSLLEMPEYLGPIRWGEFSGAKAALPQLKLGQPVPNARVLILDELGQPVPAGVPGWIHFGGEGLALVPGGHTERGVPSCWLARYDRSGAMELVGERGVLSATPGFRLELREVQSTVCDHPAVFSARIKVSRLGDRSELLAFVVQKPGVQVDAGEIREFIRSRLPEYMVPARVCVLPSLELSETGEFAPKIFVQDEVAARAEKAPLDGPTNDVERALCEIWAGVFRLDRVGVHENFFELGGDSILTLQMISKASQRGIRLAPRVIWQNPTISTLAQAAGGGTAVTHAEQGTISGAVPLSPIQHWFFGFNLSKLSQWNQAVLLEVAGNISVDQFRSVLSALVHHHDVLRLRFYRENGKWEQANDAREANVVLDKVSIQVQAIEQREASLRESYDAVQASLNIEDGPLIRARWHDMGEGSPSRVLIVIHHLAVDGVSWRVLLEDLELGLGQLGTGQPIKFPPKTTSFKAWAERLVKYGKEPELLEEAEYWQDVLKHSKRGLKPDFAAGRNIESATFKVSTVFERDESRRLLTETPVRFQAQIHELLLYALGRALEAHVGDGGVILDLEGHGREDLFEGIDISRTVGWFTTIYPFHLDVSDDPTPEAGIRKIREDLRQIPNKGFGFAALKYLAADASIRESLSAWPTGQVVFNYLGQFDGASNNGDIRRVWGFNGTGRAVENLRTHLLEINAHISEGLLKVNWTFSVEVFKAETIQALAQTFQQEVRSALGIEGPLLQPQGGRDAGRSPAVVGVKELATGSASATIEKLPLSPMQRLFYTMAQSGGGYGFEQFRFRIRGSLNPDDFRDACFRVFRRHVALRLSISSGEDGEPYQNDTVGIIPEWRNEDWMGESEKNTECRLNAFLEEDRNRGFNLAEPPLHRFALIRLAEQEWEWIWSFHHILMDGWSWPIVYGEIAAQYAAVIQGLEASLPPAPQFSEYIRWLQSQDSAKARLYWRRSLKGFDSNSSNAWPKAGTQGGSENTVQAECKLQFEAKLINDLSLAARKHQVTLHTLFEAAWAISLAHLSGREDVTFGETVSGRPADLPGADSIVGMFINNLPRRVVLKREQDVVEFLKNLQGDFLEMSEHQHSSLLQIQEWCGTSARSRLFNTLLLVQNYARKPVENKDGAELLRRAAGSGKVRTSYAMTLMVVPAEEGYIKLIYQSPIVDEELAFGSLKCIHAVLGMLCSLESGIVGRILDRLSEVYVAKEREVISPSARHERVEPRTPAEKALADIWRKSFGNPNIGVEDNFFDLGGDSLLTFHIISNAAKKGFRITPKQIWEHPTISDLSKVIDSVSGIDDRRQGFAVLELTGGSPAGTQAPITSKYQGANGASEEEGRSFSLALKTTERPLKEAVFCLHFLTAARNMAKHMRAELPVYGVYVPLDRELKLWHREGIVDLDLKDLAGQYVNEILKIQPEGTYHLVGYCFGGTLAYEVARQLKLSGAKVGFVGILEISYAAGCKRVIFPAARRAIYHASQIFSLGFVYLKKKIAWKLEKAKKHRRAIAAIGQKARDGGPEGEGQTVRLPQADFLAEILKGYQASPYAGDVVVVRSSTEPSFRIHRGKASGWDAIVQGQLQVEELACGHLDMCEEPNVQELAAIVDKHLIAIGRQ